MSGKVSCGCGASSPDTSPSHRGQLAPHGRLGSPPPRTDSATRRRSAAAGAVTAVCALRRVLLRRTRCGWRARPGANFPDGVPAPGWAVRAPKACGPRGQRQRKPPMPVPVGGRAESGPAGLKLTSPGPPPAPRPAAPAPEGPDSCDSGHSSFAKRAQPLAGKVPAVAAGGGRILTFSARWPQRERDAEKQEPPQRGRGPSSGDGLHSFDLG